ncbi:LysM domain-containing protein, partial [Vibrio sp. M250220]
MTTYTIQPGDTLLQIAIDQGVEYVDLLTLNPQCQTDPNYIRAGDTLT